MASPLPAGATENPDQYRLPTSVKPTHYDVVIKTDLEALRFEGVVKVNLDIVDETTSITLNTANLDLGKVTFYSDALKAEQVPTGQSFDKTQERTAFQLATPLPAGSKGELKIGFAGELTGSMMGYYKSSWEKDGKTQNYALTQFEPTAARRAFPCWDEPLLKATFGITMVSRADTTNLSNMPATSEETIEPNSNIAEEIRELVATAKQEEKWKVTKFQNTPPMSTYLVAVANGHFKFLETSVKMPLSGKTIPLRIYTTPEVIHQAQFALDVKAAALPLYEQIFNVEYPLPKLDTLVAHDFDAGAMENWGLITGRTSVFLLDPERADQQSRKRVASVQSHEVAHMWFGNITTMEWWNYLYLNEGFATLMGEVIIPDKQVIFPEWRVDSEFISDHLNRALSLDAKLSSHPIEVDCPDANHINQIFDALSYSKAASVLRMLSNYVGEERFLKGVSLYLKKKLFANSKTHDLWEGISTATDLNITNIMENWITKIGFPVLTVTEDKQGIRVRQDRFLETGAAEPKDNETIWNIPLFILSAQDGGKLGVDKSAILEEREKIFPVDTSKPFKLNAGTVGVYRVLYTPERLAKIAEEAAKGTSAFGINDRIGLVHDAMALSKAGFAKVSSALTLVDLLKNETEYLVWDGIAESISGLYSIWWEHPEILKQISAFRRSLFTPLVDKLGYEFSDSDSRDVKLLRKLAISQAAYGHEDKVINELKSRFDHFVKTGDDSKIPADLQAVIFATAVKYGGAVEYDAVVGIHDKPKTPMQKIAAMTALGNAQEPELIKRTFDSISTKARDQDIMYYFSGLSGNFKTRRLLISYFQEQYDVLYKRFEGNFTLQYLVKYSLEFLSTKEDLAKVKAFFKDKDTSKYNQSLAQTLDSIRARAEYIERSTEDLGSWLAEWSRMPAFDPVRDAVLNSPVEQQQSHHASLFSPLPSPSITRRATDLSVLLNSEPALPTRSSISSASSSSSISSLLTPSNDDDKLSTSEPLMRRFSNSSSRSSQTVYPAPPHRDSPSPTRYHHTQYHQQFEPMNSRPTTATTSSGTSYPSSRPSSSSSTSAPATKHALRHTSSPSMPPPPAPPVSASASGLESASGSATPTPGASRPAASSSSSRIPYRPTKRITPAGSVLIPLTQQEIETFEQKRGWGSKRLIKRKRSESTDEPQGDATGELEQRPAKRLHSDVEVVVGHYNSRPDVGVVQRQESPIIGLKNFNNWVKSVLITRFAHPVLQKSSVGSGRGGGRGKVMDMGCGKGGDMTKWAKAQIKELLGADIAEVSVEQARNRYKQMRSSRFEAKFEAIDCYTQPLAKAFSPAKLSVPFDVVSMQFCMHYAFETVQKARCMLDNVSRYMRPGGVFIGTIPNAEQLLAHLDAIPPDAEDLSFGNSVYKIRFEQRDTKPVFGHKYWFFLQDAVENVPEYVVQWDNFVQMAAEYNLYPIYKAEFHHVFEEHQEIPEFKNLMVRMKVVDSNGESSMDEDQWEAANIYIAFAFEKR